MEGKIGGFRRRDLVPVPSVASLAELNAQIAAADHLDDDRVITGRPITVGAASAAEAAVLMELPAEVFDCARLLQARVDTGPECLCGNISTPCRHATPDAVCRSG